jgi:hypothetical protein
MILFTSFCRRLFWTFETICFINNLMSDSESIEDLSK